MSSFNQKPSFKLHDKPHTTLIKISSIPDQKPNPTHSKLFQYIFNKNQTPN